MAFTIQQDIFKNSHPTIKARKATWDRIERPLNDFLATLDGNESVGLSPTYGKKSRLSTLAIASTSIVLLISLPSISSSKKGDVMRFKYQLRSLEAFLTDPTVTKYAFQMDKLSAALFCDLGICISRGKDVLSISKYDRHSIAAILEILGNPENIDPSAVKKLFRDEERQGNDERTIALQAWAAYCSACDPALSERHGATADINTDSLEPHVRIPCTSSARCTD